MKIRLQPLNIIVAFTLLFLGQYCLAQGNGDTLVVIMHIDDVIDPRLNRYTELAFEQADNLNADIVIIKMNTFGGAVNDADEIRTRILDYNKPVWVFIDNNAASAGALISIACDSIYMSGGASIGAATVVTQDGTAAPDKYQSYMRSIMRSTAEAKGRDPKIAEAMVDENLEVDSISSTGEVITFSTSEAIKYGFCEGEVETIEEILEINGVDEYTIEEFTLSSTEKVIKLFLNPFISGLLILVIIGGIYFELQTPGIGFPLAAALVALVLYLVPYYLNGLADNWEILMFVIGIALIALEIFVIPGFGVAGVTGMVMTLASLILVMLNNDLFDFSFVNTKEIFTAVVTLLGGLTGGILLIFFGGVRFTNTKLFQRISLQETEKRSDGYTSNFKQESYIGKRGVAYTVLRPSGKVTIDEEIFDAYTRGDYINKGDPVIVIGEEGTSLKVKLNKKE
ncbi:nodulation protein NfeD [Bacteroidota bacterium]